MFGSSSFGTASFGASQVVDIINKAEIIPKDAKKALEEFVLEGFNDVWTNLSDLIDLTCDLDFWQELIDLVSLVLNLTS